MIEMADVPSPVSLLSLKYKLIGSEVVLGTTETASEPFSVQVLSRKPHTTIFISPVCLSSPLSVP